VIKQSPRKAAAADVHGTEAVAVLDSFEFVYFLACP
jgi:hypothetical protein